MQHRGHRALLGRGSPATNVSLATSRSKELVPVAAAASQPAQDGARRFSSGAASGEAGTLPPFLDEVLRGMGQVVFCNSPVSGALITTGLLVGDPWLGVLAAGGCASATAAAKYLGASPAQVSAGLLGYNGALVGCAFSVFLGAPAWGTVAATAVGGGASALVAMNLGKVMTTVPQWTLAFNITALSALAFVKPFAGKAAAAFPLPMSVLEPLDWISSCFVGVSQIFVVNDPLAGALILAGIAAYSRAAAGYTLLGAAVGVLAAVLYGADMQQVKDGLWGFNPALTALSVSIFFAPSSAAAGFAAVGALLTAGVTVWMNSIGASFDVPSLTLPFCAMATVCFLTGGRAGLVRAP